MCNSSLPPPPQSESVVPRSLLPILHLQLDNACSDNKNRYTFCFFSLLVVNGVFREVYVNFMLVGHTHEDIDALFGRWSMRLWKHDYPIVPLLMKSFMDGESIPVIPILLKKFRTSRASSIHASARKAKLWKDTPPHKRLNST
jgi:hypothetical protein